MNFPTSLPKTWNYDSVFPYQEGTHFEFKNTKNLQLDLNNFKDKWNSIMCGIMNSGGGWFIIGIEDENNLIKGLPLKRKDIDLFQLWTDNLYRIIYNSDGTVILPQQVHLKVFIWTINNKKDILLALKCLVNKSNDLHFQMSNGQIFYRLNASTLLMNGEPVLKQSQIYQRDKENAGVIRQYQDEIEKKNKELITKELERRKLQSNLDQEIRLRDSLIKKEIILVSDSLYQFYRVKQKPKETNQSVIIPIQTEETEETEDPDDSQAKYKDIKLSCKSLTGYTLVALCFVSTYMWIGSKIYFI